MAELSCSVMCFDELYTTNIAVRKNDTVATGSTDHHGFRDRTQTVPTLSRCKDPATIGTHARRAYSNALATCDCRSIDRLMQKVDDQQTHQHEQRALPPVAMGDNQQLFTVYKSSNHVVSPHVAGQKNGRLKAQLQRVILRHNNV